MGWVAGVFDNPPGFPCTLPGVDVLEGGKLTSNNVAGSSHDPLQSFAVASCAVSKPGGDAAGQDALHRIEAVMGGDLGRPEGEKSSPGAWIASSAAAPRVLGFPAPE